MHYFRDTNDTARDLEAQTKTLGDSENAVSKTNQTSASSKSSVARSENRFGSKKVRPLSAEVLTL